MINGRWSMVNQNKAKGRSEDSGRPFLFMWEARPRGDSFVPVGAAPPPRCVRTRRSGTLAAFRWAKYGPSPRPNTQQVKQRRREEAN